MLEAIPKALFHLLAASGTVILINGLGAVLGPVLVAGAMQAAGPGAYFASVVVLHASLAAYAIWRKLRAKPVPSDAKVPFTGAPPQAAPTGRLTSPAGDPGAAH